MAIVPPWQRVAENERLDAALFYARAGLRVFPCHGIRDGACTCGDPACARPAKHPWTRHGLHDATTEESVIIRWWGEMPLANIGLVAADIGVVLDVDPRNGGDASLDRLIDRYGKLPDTVEVMTGGGGMHYWFYLPEGVQLKKGALGPEYPGIDIQAVGAYAIAPPSQHASGRSYQFEGSSDFCEGHPIARAPDWLLDLTRGHRHTDAPTQPRRAQPVPRAAPPGEADRVRAALSTLSADAYDTWIEIGQALHSTDWLEAFELWDTWSQTSSKYRDIHDLRRRWSGFDSFRPITLRTVFWHAKRAGYKPTASAAAAAVPIASMLVPAGQFASQFRRPEYVVDGIVQGGRLHACTGHSNAGKTAILLEMGCCVCMGRLFAGIETRRGRVLFLAGENAEDVRGRLLAWCEANGCAPSELDDWMHVYPAAGPIEELANGLIEACNAIGSFALVIVDSKLPYFGGDDENDNPQGLAQAKAFRRFSEEIAGLPAVVVLGHPRKGAHSPEELHPRGALAYLNEIDTNLIAFNEGEVVRFHWAIKIRGPSFEPRYFRMMSHELAGTADRHGRNFQTVLALPMSAPEGSQADALQEANDVLSVIVHGLGKRSLTDVASILGWVNERGEPAKAKVQRRMQSLLNDKLIYKPREHGNYAATKAGKQAVEELEKSLRSYREIRG